MIFVTIYHLDDIFELFLYKKQIKDIDDDDYNSQTIDSVTNYVKWSPISVTKIASCSPIIKFISYES